MKKIAWQTIDYKGVIRPFDDNDEIRELFNQKMTVIEGMKNEVSAFIDIFFKDRVDVEFSWENPAHGNDFYCVFDVKTKEDIVDYGRKQQHFTFICENDGLITVVLQNQDPNRRVVRRCADIAQVERLIVDTFMGVHLPDDYHKNKKKITYRAW